MSIDAQIDAMARHIEAGFRRRPLSRRHRNKEMAVAQATAQAAREVLTDLRRRMAADEALVDLAHAERYTVGPQGVRLTLSMLVATNQRLWHLVHRDGAVVTPVPMPPDRVTARKRTLMPSIAVEQSGHGWTVTGTKSLVALVEDMVRTRPQRPVGLLAKVTARSGRR